MTPSASWFRRVDGPIVVTAIYRCMIGKKSVIFSAPFAGMSRAKEIFRKVNRLRTLLNPQHVGLFLFLLVDPDVPIEAIFSDSFVAAIQPSDKFSRRNK